MKKTFIFTLGILALLFYSCGDKKVPYNYSTHNGKEFSIDYPTNWTSEIEAFPVAPFVAYSDYQTIRVGTRLIGDVSLDSFVTERIVRQSLRVGHIDLGDTLLQNVAILLSTAKNL